MKDAKIDKFIDRSISEDLDESIYDNIVTFLKVNVRMCNTLLGMDSTDIESVLDGFGNIIFILDEGRSPTVRASTRGR